MAVSKNNRKKGKKRTPSHRAPVTAQQREQKTRIEEKQRVQEKQNLRLSLIAVAIMGVGLFVAWRWSRLIGYPITFVGGLAGIYAERKSGKQRKLTLICYTIYCILVAYMWIAAFMAA